MPYTLNDYMQSETPYKEAYSYHKDPFKFEQKVAQMSIDAEAVGFRGFKKMLSKYSESLKMATTQIYINNATQFTGQKVELEAGDWTADDFGIRRSRGVFEEIACCHPIAPIERLVNIDTGTEKLKVWYTRNRRPRTVIVDKSVLASPQKIVALSDMGIAVNSENAKALINWIHDAENLNYETIPEKQSISRLGYIEGEGFSPYVENLIFDGDANYRNIFESIQSSGSRDEWMQLALKIRKTNVMARIVLAASFASVLVSPCGVLPFFVHLWGGEAGTGKTVALMLAASVWANPEIGRYIQTFNSTVVGQEKLASFLNHLPMMIDELQLAKDSRGRNQFSVYALAEGVGRTRGTKSGGIERTPTWGNCIITTGESPITAANSGAGAIGRVIEIECLVGNKIIDDGHETSNILRRNYGFVGKEFVETIYTDGYIEKARTLYSKFFKQLSFSDAAEKNQVAAALIMTADALATEIIFQDDRAIGIDDIAKFMATKAASSAGERGYRYMVDWVAKNANKLDCRSEAGDVYGVIVGETAYIINSIFRTAAEEAGFSSTALLSYMKAHGLLEVRSDGKGTTKSRRIGVVVTQCVGMRIVDIDEQQVAQDMEF